METLNFAQKFMLKGGWNFLFCSHLVVRQAALTAQHHQRTLFRERLADIRTVAQVDVLSLAPCLDFSIPPPLDEKEKSGYLQSRGGLIISKVISVPYSVRSVNTRLYLYQVLPVHVHFGTLSMAKSELVNPNPFSDFSFFPF